MSKHAFDAKVEALATLDAAGLKKALGDKNNFYVGKAAKRAAAAGHHELIDAMLAAWQRFYRGGAETDAKCWAKTELILALHTLGYLEPELYLEALTCRQLEAVWGGREDTAGAVRATAALAIIDCQIDRIRLLRALVHPLNDADHTVRIEAIRALVRLGTWEGELLLRQRAISGDNEPEVLGALYSAILELDQADCCAFVARFLDSDDEQTQAEAAAALAQSRHTAAIESVDRFWGRILPRDLRRAVLVSLGVSPLSEARELLLKIESESDAETARWAKEALAARHRD